MSSSRRQFLKTLGATTVTLPFIQGCVSPSEARPIRNVVFLISDDHAAHVAGCYGNQVVRTPNIDQLAATGVLFDKAYANALQAPDTALYGDDTVFVVDTDERLAPRHDALAIRSRSHAAARVERA